MCVRGVHCHCHARATCLLCVLLGSRLAAPLLRQLQLVVAVLLDLRLVRAPRVRLGLLL
jgi:hypothetical protein